MAAAHGDSLAIPVKPLHPLFGAEIGHVEIGRPLDDSTFAEIRAAFEDYSLLLFRDQELDDDKQIAFSERCGPLETTVKANPAGGTYFARQSNLDIDTGAVIPPEDRRIIYQKANMFWRSASRRDAAHERSGACGMPLGGSARDWAHRTIRRPRRGLPTLRLALAELARHYRMPLE